MIELTPLTDIELGHRAYFVDASESGHIVALAEESFGTLISPDQSIATFQVRQTPTDVAISPDGSVVAVVGREVLFLISTAGLKEIQRIEGFYDRCRFGADGALWCSDTPDGDKIRLEVRSPGTWELAARAEVKDPYGDCNCQLYSHPDRKHVSMRVAAGQDGQCLFWAHREESDIEVRRFDGLNDTSPPGFSPDGSQFLVQGLTELLQYEFPHGPLRGAMEWPASIDDALGDYVAFVDSNRAVVTSRNSRLYLVDLQRMAIVDEIVIRGHERRSFLSMHDSVTREPELYGDLSSLVRLASGDFLSVHHDYRSYDAKSRHDRLLTWRVSPPVMK